MSVTAIAWLLLFCFLAARSFSRPMYGVFLYIQTFFAAPQFWWWGEGVLLGITDRWNIAASVILAVSVVLNFSKRRTYSKLQQSKWTLSIALLAAYVVNAAVVHYTFASDPEQSWIALDLVLKQFVLTLLLYSAIDSRKDLDSFLTAIWLGCVFIGYQVVINDAGYFARGRLEGVYIPGTSSANGASAILIVGLCIGGYLFLTARTVWKKYAIAAGCVLILDTVLRCNSRGAFLGLGVAAVWMAVAAGGRARKQIIVGLMLGAVAVLVQARDEFIWQRFDTTFAEAEERDGAANERLDYWEAGLQMLFDYPFGSGGESGFKSPLGMTYIAHIRQDEYRAVHNGYLDIAIGWGLQGFILLICAICIGFASTWSLTRRLRRFQPDVVLLGATIQAILVTQLVTAVFLSRLDHEVFNWLIVVCAVFYREHIVQVKGSYDTIADQESVARPNSRISISA